MSRKRNRSGYRKPAAARKAVREEPSLPVQMKNPLTRNQALKDVLRALDGYSNALAFLGEDSPLISAGTFHRSGLTSQTELLTVTYRENWLAKRIIDMPCEDMTRAWYRLSTALPEAELHRLKRLEARHSVKQEIANAIRWARLYGGALALIVIRGEERRLDLPLDTDVLMPGCFQGLLVLDRAQGIEPSAELVRDLDDPDFGLPMFYTVTLDTEQGWENPAAGDTEQAERRGRFCSSAFGVTSRSRPLVPPSDQMIAEDGYPTPTRVRIHHSRVLRFIGRELPRMETIAENYWGASELEHIWEELQKRSATSANIAQLIFQANITTLNVYQGFEKVNSTGLVNNPAIARISAATAAGGGTRWSQKTADEILNDINSAISALWKDNDCSIDALPNHILVPVEQFGALVTRKVSDDSERSILSYVLENNLTTQQGGELVISPCKWCSRAGSSRDKVK